MRHEQQRPFPRFEGPLQLFDCRNVQMVGGLVQDQAVRPAGDQESQLRPGPLPGGQRGRDAEHVRGSEAELGQERACLRLGCRRTERDQKRAEQGGLPLRETTALLTKLTHNDRRAGKERTRLEGDPPQQRGQERRLPASIGTDYGKTVGPAHLEIERAELPFATTDDGTGQAGDDVAAAILRLSFETRAPPTPVGRAPARATAPARPRSPRTPPRPGAEPLPWPRQIPQNPRRMSRPDVTPHRCRPR